eukprot:4229265-Pleurochrysis_carterae.AAC.2
MRSVGRDTVGVQGQEKASHASSTTVETVVGKLLGLCCTPRGSQSECKGERGGVARLVDDRRLKVDEDAARHVLACAAGGASRGRAQRVEQRACPCEKARAKAHVGVCLRASECMQIRAGAAWGKKRKTAKQEVQRGQRIWQS